MKIAVPDLISNSYLPAPAAVELGFFEKEGLDMTYELIFPVDDANKALRDGKLDLRCVLRDMIGKRLVKKTETMAGCILELSPAGVQAANARNVGKKRKR